MQLVITSRLGEGEREKREVGNGREGRGKGLTQGENLSEGALGEHSYVPHTRKKLGTGGREGGREEGQDLAC